MDNQNGNGSKLKIIILVVVIALGIIIFFVMRGFTPEKTASLGVGFIGKVETVNPLMVSSEEERQILDGVFRGLYRWNDKWEKDPQGCSKIPTQEDGTLQPIGSIMVKLFYTTKDSLYWSNGDPVTSQDFLFAYQMSYNPLFKGGNRDWYPAVQKVETPNKETFTIAINSSCRDLPLYPLPKKVVEEKFKNLQDLAGERFIKDITYNGPFMVESLEPRRVVITRNLKYPGNIPPMKTIQFNFYNRDSDMEGDLKSGKLQMAYGFSYSRARETVAKNQDLIMLWEPTSRQKVLIPNINNPLIGDPQLRKAILMGINRKLMAKDIFGHEKFMTRSWLSPRHAYYKEVLKEYDFSPDKAGEILDRLGYGKDESGKRSKDGTPLVFSVLIPDDSPEDFAVFQFFQGSMADLGITVSMEAYPRDVYQEYLVTAKFKDFTLVNLDTPPWVDPGSYFSSTRIPNNKNKFKGMNYSHWQDEKNDKICLEYNKTYIPEEQKEIMGKQQDNFAEHLPLIPLINTPEVVVCKKTLKNIKPRGFGTITWNIEEWQWVNK